jgi:hypothetical protein
MTLGNLLSSCLISKTGTVHVVTFTFSVPAGSFYAFSPGESKDDPGGKVGICRDTSIRISMAIRK